MAGTHMDIQYVAQLARLNLSTDEQTKLGRQLDQILDHIEKLKEVDVSGVEPTAHAFPMVNITRADEPRPSMPHEDALRNAPAKANGLFIVPKIVE
jgi:aspartyl-tRNA(Asn)/glutamyl-tRNA(Gln) amidotransferase subunit C